MSESVNMPAKAAVLAAAAVGGSPFVPLLCVLTQRRKVFYQGNSY
jgi:hypothetical protein